MTEVFIGPARIETIALHGCSGSTEALCLTHYAWHMKPTDGMTDWKAGDEAWALEWGPVRLQTYELGLWRCKRSAAQYFSLEAVHVSTWMLYRTEDEWKAEWARRDAVEAAKTRLVEAKRARRQAERAVADAATGWLWPVDINRGAEQAEDVLRAAVEALGETRAEVKAARAALKALET